MNKTERQFYHDLNEELERLYWEFDARRSGYPPHKNPMVERDAFKQTIVSVVAEFVRPTELLDD